MPNRASQLDVHVPLRPKWLERISSAGSKFPSQRVALDQLPASRTQVLAAATRRLVEEPLGVLAQGLNPSRFESWMPGLRRKAYRMFPSSSELVKEVLMLAVDPERAEATDELVNAMTAVAYEAVGPLEAVHTLPAAYIDRILDDNVFRLELTAWLAMPSHLPLRHELKMLHQSLIDRGAAGLQTMLSSFDLEPRPPLTWSGIATMLLPVVQGTVLSAEVRGADYDPDVLVHTVMAIVMSTTRPIGSGEPDLESTFLSHLERR